MKYQKKLFRKRNNSFKKEYTYYGKKYRNIIQEYEHQI